MLHDPSARADNETPIRFVTPKCPVCGSESAAVYPYNPDPGVTAAAFSGIVAFRIFAGDVRVCGVCGHGRIAAMPSDEELFSYYSKTYWSGRGYSAHIEEAPHYRYRAAAQVRFIESFLDYGCDINMLEIGAGSAAASRRVRELFGSRVHLNVCEPAEAWRSFYEANNIRHIAKFFPFAREFQADHIHASHWLEHVIDLQGTVSEVARVCRDGGTVFIEVPNTGHDYWKLGIPSTPHLHFFTAESLRRAFCERGFVCCCLGEFGPTMNAWWGGARPGEGDYEANKKGMWLRALFQRK